MARPALGGQDRHGKSGANPHPAVQIRPYERLGIYETGSRVLTADSLQYNLK